MARKFSVEDIAFSLNTCDLWPLFVLKEQTAHNQIFLYSSEDSEVGPIYLEITFFDKHAKFTRGHLLTAEEKSLVFRYCYSENVASFADYLVNFIKQYVQSFKVVRIIDSILFHNKNINSPVTFKKL